jgi:hypothetical protein
MVQAVLLVPRSDGSGIRDPQPEVAFDTPQLAVEAFPVVGDQYLSIRGETSKGDRFTETWRSDSRRGRWVQVNRVVRAS